MNCMPFLGLDVLKLYIAPGFGASNIFCNNLLLISKYSV